MKVGAVAVLGGASPDGIAAAPTFAGFVVAHGGDDVIVDVAGFLERRSVAGGLLAGKFGGGADDGDGVVRLEIALHEGIAGGSGGDVLHRGGMDVYSVFAASGIEE